MSLYLAVNLLSISIPFIFSFHKKLNFYKTWPALFPSLLATAAIFIIWDIYFTEWGIWGFNPDYLIGINILGLPLEEWLFFIAIPYACVFTYVSLKTLVKKDILGPYAKKISWVIIAVLVITAASNIDKLYTGVTFFYTALFLLKHILIINSNYLGRFYLAYLVIYLGPFLIVNGILTGSFIEDQIVWYNNDENMGIRVFTIPVEDFVYGFLLYLTNVTLYEWFSNKKLIND